MASITKRGEGYRVRWRDPDGRARSRQAPTLRAAKALQREVEEAGALGRRWEPADAGPRVGVERVAAAWIAQLAVTKAPNTVTEYATRLDLLVAFLRTQHPREVPALDMLSQAALREGWVWLKSTGGFAWKPGRAVPRCNEIVRTWQRLWAWAYDSDEFGDACPRPRRIDFPKTATDPVPAASWAEVDAMLRELRTRRRKGGGVDYTDTVDWQSRVGVLVRYTGARVGAALALDWADVDLDGGRVHIRAETTKTKTGRILPLHPGLRDELAGWGLREGPVCGIPPGRTAAVTGSGQCMRRAWEATGARREIWLGRPAHSMRRTWRTSLVAAGVHPDVVDLLLGHVPRGTGGRHYTDPGALWPEMVAAVGEVPAIGEGKVRKMRRRG